ncbi:MAG: LCP family protein [Clostridia bacterium]|nr:LCP family protein [Clostridia bacterium]
MNNNYPGGQRPQNRRRPTGPASRPVRQVSRPVAPPPRPRTPAWKVLVTVLILVLSVVLVLGALAYAFIPGFFENPVKAIGALFKPEIDGGSSWSADGAPIIDADRDDAVYNFLIVGLNADLGNNTDTIMLVQYNVSDGRINVVQVPRDTYIDAGYNFHKINSVFSAAYNSGSGKAAERRVTGMEGDKDKGITGLCEFVENCYAVKIDYYALIDLDAFQGFIDKLGGLRVNVPTRMKYSDPEQDLYIDLYPGEQTLSGYQAMCLVRNRKSYIDQDYGRMDAQKIVLSALLKQIKADFNADTLGSLIEFAFDNVTTNLSLKDCIYFGTQALSVDMANMKMVTMPTMEYGKVILTSETSCVEVVNKYLNVYAEDITAEDFDRGNRLTNTEDADLHKAYRYDTVDYSVYDADSVDKNSIDFKTYN